jgi:integrase
MYPLRQIHPNTGDSQNATSYSVLPKYRKHKASGQAFVELNGHRHYLGPYGTKASKLEYDRLIGEWLQHGRQSPAGPDRGGLTVVELIVAYLNFAKSYYRKDGQPTNEVRDIRLSLRPVKTLYGRQPCSEFGPTALKVVRQKMVDDGLSRKLINQRIGRVKRMFKWGASSELIPASIPQSLSTVEGLKRGRTEARETKPVRPVVDAMVDATLLHLPSVVADMVRLQRFTGMRPAELCILRPMDLDRADNVWTYRPESHKTQHHGKERVVCIGPQAQGVLLRYLARDPAAYCFRPCDSESKRLADRHAARIVPLSCGNRPGSNRVRKAKRLAGERYTTHSYYYAIRRACDKAFTVPQELTDDAAAKWRADHRWSPLQIRHSAATEIRRRYGLEAAQVALPHTQPGKESRHEVYKR